MILRWEKRGQITIFIILALVIVGGVVLFFALRNSISEISLSGEFEEPYKSYSLCLEHQLEKGINLALSGGGYIYSDNFERGSAYAPSSNQLNFFGRIIPYWSYFSSGNLLEINTPNKRIIESEIEKYILEVEPNCRLDEYESQGIYTEYGGDSVAKVIVGDKNVRLEFEKKLYFNKENFSQSFFEHKVEVDSSLGSLFNRALKVFELEKENNFLEDYTIDFLRLYAPVDGFELSCSPLTWNANNVYEDLFSGIINNVNFLKGEENDFELVNLENKYFVVDLDENVKFLTLSDWPKYFEVNPTQGSMMIANSVGNQEGLGILGFCFVPYHFVYSLKYSVLVQIAQGDEIFQFPIVVSIEKNKPYKDYLPSESFGGVVDNQICEFKNTLSEVSVYDETLNSIEANVSYSCFNENCFIGETVNGKLNEFFPQCVNGLLKVESEGYSSNILVMNTISESEIDVFLEKEYVLDLELEIEGKSFGESAIINVNKNDESFLIVYPETKKISLSEGEYEFLVYVYKPLNLSLGSSTYSQCVSVPRGGIGGYLGLRKENCFDVEIPETLVTSVLSAGGKRSIYIAREDLRENNKLILGAENLLDVKSIEDISTNYLLFDEKKLEVVFL